MATPSFFISFGLVTIPVKAHPAAREARISFNQVHAKCGRRLKQSQICAACQETAEGEQIAKGYPIEHERYVVITKEEVEALAAEKSKTMDAVATVPLAGVDPVYYGASNYLVPVDEGAAKAFHLFREALGKKKRGALVQYRGSGRDKLGFVRPYRHVLMLHELFYLPEVRQLEAGDVRETTVGPEELKLAVKLLESLEAPFDLSAYRDEYHERLNALVQAKVAGTPAPALPDAPKAQIVDLMAALEKSLAAKPAKKEKKAA